MVSASLLPFRGQFGASLQRIGNSRLGLGGCFVCGISRLGHVPVICKQTSGDSGLDLILSRADALRRLLNPGVRSLGFSDRGTLFLSRNPYITFMLACSFFGARSLAIGGGRHGQQSTGESHRRAVSRTHHRLSLDLLSTDGLTDCLRRIVRGAVPDKNVGSMPRCQQAARIVALTFQAFPLYDSRVPTELGDQPIQFEDDRVEAPRIRIETSLAYLDVVESLGQDPMPFRLLALAGSQRYDQPLSRPPKLPCEWQPQPLLSSCRPRQRAKAVRAPPGQNRAPLSAQPRLAELGGVPGHQVTEALRLLIREGVGSIARP